jgi:hypothetical protein
MSRRARFDTWAWTDEKVGIMAQMMREDASFVIEGEAVYRRNLVQTIREMADAAARQGIDASRLRIVAAHVHHGEIV